MKTIYSWHITCYTTNIHSIDYSGNRQLLIFWMRKTIKASVNYTPGSTWHLSLFLPSFYSNTSVFIWHVDYIHIPGHYPVLNTCFRLWILDYWLCAFWMSIKAYVKWTDSISVTHNSHINETLDKLLLGNVPIVTWKEKLTCYSLSNVYHYLYIILT